MNDSSNIFNRKLYTLRRNRAAAQWEQYNFLKTEAAERIVDKLADISRRFSFALDVGCHHGEVGQAITGRVDHVMSCDMAEAMRPSIVCDEEWLPFAEESFDLVTSALALHHVNDLPGTLIQICRCLKADGLFVGIVPGANTLKELRTSITQVSAELGFPLCPHLSPLVEIRDAGALLQRAGFALPVIDSEIITVEYDSVQKLWKDLQGMGENNILVQQFNGLHSRAKWAAVASYYETDFAKDGVFPATFEFISLTGWKPHVSQQQPSKRGTGTTQLNKVF